MHKPPVIIPTTVNVKPKNHGFQFGLIDAIVFISFLGLGGYWIGTQLSNQFPQLRVIQQQVAPASSSK